MKLIHLGDLHLGKRVNGFSMLDDQREALRQILAIIDAERPDGVMVAGDVYDKAIPSTEAVALLDEFLVELSSRETEVFLISGNHDSPERLSFANRLIDRAGIHLSPVYDGRVEPFELTDAHGPVRIYMLPFIKPAAVRAAWPDEDIATWTDAVRAAVSHMDVDPAARNVLIAHQFVTDAVRSESEELSVGTADNVDADAFEGFDYVALGHLHGPQDVPGRPIRYCGSPIKYSFSEADHVKSVTVVELGGKGCLDVREIPLKPLRDMRRLRGSYEALTLKANYEGTAVDDYLEITLTDEDEIPLAMEKLRTVYPNVMKLRYDNARMRSSGYAERIEHTENERPIDLFGRFFEMQYGAPLTDAQRDYSEKLFESLAGSDV